MSENLYKRAAQLSLRFPSSAGALTVEQLFQLHLKSNAGRPDLDGVAKTLYEQIQKVGNMSFVETSQPDPEKVKLELAFEIVKDVIATKQAENSAALELSKKKALKQKLLDAIAAKEEQKLTEGSIEDLKKQLEALGL